MSAAGGAPSNDASFAAPVVRIPSVHPSLRHAPAAVQAASEQVLAAHAAFVDVEDDVEPRPVESFAPKSQPRRPARPEESSGSSTASIKVGTVVNGRYHVERMIGRGGMGTVYSVRHVNTGEELALKVLHPALAENDTAVERFRTEARAPVRIGSEHVVRVVDADVCTEIGDTPFMVMEMLCGRDLRKELKRRGALPAGEVVLYLAQAARALDKAHAKGIIHRDLKPENLYLTEREDGSPHVKVLDFGIAKLTEDAAPELTVAGQIFGTPWYMAPEQARGDLPAVGPQTDLWALGLIAYRLLSGRNYWTAEGMAALVGQICYEPMPPPTQTAPHLGPLFDVWFAKACNREPSLRFATARELIDQLAQALGVNQTGAGFTTGSINQLDSSSLQIQVPAAQTGPSASGGHQAVSLNTPTGEQSVPGVIPGTALGTGQHPALGTGQHPALGTGQHPALGTGQHPALGTGQHPALDSTNAPLYSTPQPSLPRKKSSTAAVALGVVMTAVVAVGAVGVYLVMSSGSTAEGPAAPTSAPAAASPNGDSDADEPEATDDNHEASNDKPEASNDKDSAVATTSAEPSAAPKATTTTKPQSKSTQSKPEASKPPEAKDRVPKVAPKVDNVSF